MPRLEILELMEQAQASYFEKRPPRVRRRASCFARRLFAARALRQRLAVRRDSGKNVWIPGLQAAERLRCPQEAVTLRKSSERRKKSGILERSSCVTRTAM